MSFFYNFPAVKGVQAKSEYYICMIPCKLLNKLFITEPTDILPEHRSQRRLNYSRIPKIKNYIINHRNSYVFSALAASIDGNFTFKSKDNSDLGMLEIDMNSIFLINDGQHRKAAIQSAIEEDSSIGEETIPVVFFKDKGLKRSQQMFSDLNKHAINTSKSLNTLYDFDDKIAVITTEIIDKIPFFKMYTDKENDTLGKFSQKLFTLNNMYNANLKLLNGERISDKDKKFALEFWENVSDNIQEWNDLTNKVLTKKSLREDFIITQGVVLLALGKLGNYFLNNPNIDFRIYLINLNNINWLRSNEIWEKRTIRNGRIVRKEENINLTFIKIKELINLPLTEKEDHQNKNLK